MSINDLGAVVPFGEAYGLIRQLAELPGTMTHADLNGWHWPATEGDLLQIEHLEWFENVHRKPELDPIHIRRPWDAPVVRVEAVSPEEFATAKARLESSTVWSQSVIP